MINNMVGNTESHDRNKVITNNQNIINRHLNDKYHLTCNIICLQTIKNPANSKHKHKTLASHVHCIFLKSRLYWLDRGFLWNDSLFFLIWRNIRCLVRFIDETKVFIATVTINLVIHQLRFEDDVLGPTTYM